MAGVVTGGAKIAARRDWALIILAMIVTTLPLIGPTIPPLVDLMAHMGRWAIQLGQEDPFIARHYDFTTRLVGNLGYDIVVPPLARVLGLEAAVKTVTIVTAAGLAGAMLWAAREVHGRIPPAAGFALPFVYGFPFQFGFVNYWLSLALAFAGLALWLRIGPAWWRPWLFALYAIVAWLAHVMGWAVLCILIFAAEYMRLHQAYRRAFVAAAWACLPLALPVAIMAVNALTGVEPQRTYYISFASKLTWFTMALSDRWEALDLWSVAIAVGVIALAAVSRPLRFDRTLLLATGLLLIALLALPFTLMGSAYADMRLAPPLIACGLLAIKAGGRWRTALLIAGFVFFGVRTAATVRSFGLHDAAIARELSAIAHIPRNTRVLVLVRQPCDAQWMLPRTNHLASLAIVRRHAFTNDQYALEGGQLLRVRYREAGAFMVDPSQMVVSPKCAGAGWKVYSEALSSFPRAAFDMVWVIDPPVDDQPDLSGLTPVWRDGRSALYRIVKPPPR